MHKITGEAAQKAGISNLNLTHPDSKKFEVTELEGHHFELDPVSAIIRSMLKVFSLMIPWKVQLQASSPALHPEQST